jgi:hypothetical protein
VYKEFPYIPAYGLYKKLPLWTLGLTAMYRGVGAIKVRGAGSICEDKWREIFNEKGPKAYTAYDDDIQKERSLDQMLN